MITINVNAAASRSGINLGKSQDALSASLQKLSSGRRIVNPSDDAGGLAVSMKMSAAQKRTEATAINLRNIRSYLEVQDGAFQVADRVLNRMSELTTLARDVTKNAGDVENYDKEFGNLQLQLISLGTERFNGIRLFSEDAADSIKLSGDAFVVPTSEDGKQSMSATQASLTQDPYMSMMIYGYAKVGDTFVPKSGFPFTPTGGADPVGFNSAGETVALSQANIDAATAIFDGTDTTSANFKASSVDGTLNYANSDDFVQIVQMSLQQLADMRAQNGSEMSRVNFAEDLLKINSVNLEAANSRIIDVDVAAESTQLARFQILQQAGTAMLSQANTSQQQLVRLLQG
jgi:flagellin